MRILITIIVAAVSLTAHALPEVPLPQAQPLPYDRGTGPDDRDVPFLAWYEDLSAEGYREQEVLLSGEANTYRYVDDAGESTEVEVDTTGHPYTTRMLLRHPEDPADFNGVVYMEILNATARYDGAPMWDLTHRSIMRDGAAWVGVTYSDTTAAFMRDAWGTTNFPAPAGSQPRDRSRYATLNVSSRAYTWDIMSQAAALLKTDWEEQNPLGGFGVDTIIVTGYSQSARYVTTYGNSFYPQYGSVPNDPIVDGYIVGAGGTFTSTMDGEGFHRNREDARNFNTSGGYTVRYTTESDIDSALVRVSQFDNPRLRTYEAAGTSHVDLELQTIGGRMAEYQFGIIADEDDRRGCDLPLNPIRTGIPLSAAQHRLARWIQYGHPPPDDRLIDFDAENRAWLRDEDGNVTGGVRTARINVPLGTYAGTNPFSGPLSVEAILCGSIIGSFDTFSDEEIVARYDNKLHFVLGTWGAMVGQWFDGFLLPGDAPVLINDAKSIDVEGLPDRPQRRLQRRGSRGSGVR